MRKGKPRTIYANVINLSGLLYMRPIQLKWEYEADEYWDSSGDFNVKKVGEVIGDGYITFASTSEQEVKDWTNGALAVMRLLKEWSINHECSE